MRFLSYCRLFWACLQFVEVVDGIGRSLSRVKAQLQSFGLDGLPHWWSVCCVYRALHEAELDDSDANERERRKERERMKATHDKGQFPLPFPTLFLYPTNTDTILGVPKSFVWHAQTNGMDMARVSLPFPRFSASRSRNWHLYPLSGSRYTGRITFLHGSV